MSDALRIARWCWPETSWIQRFKNSPTCSCENCVGFNERLDADNENCPSGVHWYGVSSAESILFSRGLTKEYDEALCREVLGARPDSPDAVVCPDHLSRIATASLEMRVRAMVSVIEENP